MFMGGGWGGGGGMGRGGWVGRAASGATYDGWEDEALGKAYDHKVAMRLLGYILRYRVRVILAVIATVLFSLTSYTQPALVGMALDQAIKGDTQKLTWLGIALVGLAVGSWVMYYLFMTTTAWLGHRVLYNLRLEMFVHLQKLSLGFYDKQVVGRVMSRVQNDTTSMQELLTAGVNVMLADLLGLGVVVFWLFERDLILALVTLTVLPVLLFGMYLWQQRAQQAFIRVRQAISLVNGNLQENISGVRVIQSLGREEENMGRFDTLNASHRDAQIDAARLTAGVFPMVEGAVAVATALVIIFGGIRVLNGDTTIGVLVAFALYIQRFFEPIRQLTMQYTMLQRAMAGGQRIFQVLDTEPEIQDKPDAIELKDIRGAVEFDHVNFSYVPGIQVLHDFSLKVEPGETVALVGPTGSGKTTVTALVARFYDIKEGEGRILIDGYDLRDIKQSSLSNRIAMVLQEPFLFSGTIRENIRYGRLDATDEEVIEAAKVVGAHDFIMRQEHSYDTMLHERGQNLSVGQRQLLSFARAILADPRILILDEATANVDSATEAIIQRALQRVLHGRTSFVIAHRLSTIRNADKVAVLQNGRLMELGTHQELLLKDGLYSRLYHMTYQEQNGMPILADRGPAQQTLPLPGQARPVPGA